MNIVNIAAYKFVTLQETELPVLRTVLKAEALRRELKGTILLSTEGMNLILAGERQNITAYQSFLATYSTFQGLVYKESISDRKPFTRMLVRIKKEIISMGHPEIQPEHLSAPHISPTELKQWYEEKRDMVVLDTRNDYEVALGTFENAVDLHLETFRHFPDMIALLPDAMKEKPIVTFCTGGIRCEKAAVFMLNHGFKEVYQLEGGILSYFEQCGGEHYQGDCFVFDQRVALNSQLQETEITQCYDCRTPLTVEDQKLAGCPYCQHRFTPKETTLPSPQSPQT